ncbi:GapS6b family protein [Acinetobacter kyonggiensis]|uniref:PIN domain-containing protein n=1 Tax=Acinetobacter kyonggiensis TaxID=595670 RepID=A0A1H3JJM8_9GAMM|nr:hypothetical protein [Acinetobacter kyonggiensis]SDY39434.1 hypothetical protein SAMN05421643_10981 [Acinetobacter kyonggiensis]
MTESITQKHNGSGDNILGDKIINQSMQAVDFVKVAYNLYYLINIGSFDKAESKLESNIHIPSKSAGVVELLEVLTIYLNSKRSLRVEGDLNTIKRAIRSGSPEFLDFYKAILVEVTYLTSESEALEVYNNFSEDRSDYLDNINLRYFAYEDELKETFSKKTLVLDELGLLFLARGLARVEKREEALIVLEKIKDDDKNLKILKLVILYDKLLDKLDRPLEYLEENIVEEFFSIAFSFLELIKDESEIGQNALRLLINLVIKSNFSICNILDVALKFINVIRPISSEVADALENYSEKNVEINQNILSKINDLKPLKLEEAILCLNAVALNKTNLKVLIRWISQCREVEDENKFDKDLLTLVLKSFVFKDKKNVSEFEEEFSKFLDYKERKFRSIHPFYIITLCENLFVFKKQQFLNTNRLLEKVVSKNSSQSRVYLYYLYSLMNLEKYDTLKSHIQNIDSNNISSDFLILRARYYGVIGDYGNSKNDYIAIVDYYKDSLNIWLDYLLLSLKHESVDQTKTILDDIPEKILTPRAKNIFRFIYLVYTEIDSVYAEKLITKLFLMEPNFVAPYLCNMHLTLIANKKELVSNLNYDNVFEGVIYEVEGERKQKLIVSDDVSNFSHFINIDYDLGTSLAEMNEGEERFIGYQKIKLIEKQPSFITIFQIATTITEDNRHNSSDFTFLSLKVRDNFIVEDMKEILQRFTRDDHTENLISNPDLTMYIKGSLFKNHEEFETVLKILQNSKANFCLSNGVGNTTASEALIVDIYSFIYLCFNNNYKALIQSGIKIFLTQETFDVVFAWINKVTDDSFLSVALVEESLVKTDSNTVDAYYASFIDQLKELLEYAKIISPNIIDLPDFANEIRDILSPSVFSTLRLSIANDIPWLCLDSALRTIFVKQNDVKVVKLHDFLSLLGNYLEFEERKTSIIQWSNFGLFTVYSYTDLIDLARSTDSNDWILLKNLLNETPLSFNNDEQALVVLSAIMKLTLVKYLKKNNLIETTSLENLIFACLNKCMQSIYGKFREDRLAKVIVEVIDSIRFSEYLFKIFCNFLGHYAVGNFLNITYINERIKILMNDI